jgi:DNA-binding NarL/FixJ family response regulator
VINVALFSAQPILVEGLQSIFARDGNLALTAAFANVPALVADVAVHPPDVFLLEATPEVNLDLLQKLRMVAPSAPVVLWVEAVAVEFVSQVLALGVRGILRKSMPVAQLVECVRKVAGGELWIEKSLCERLICTQKVSLTPRERQLLALLAQGLKNKEIAYALQITEGTVKVYLSRLFQKVGANDRFDLALFALKNFAATPEGIPSLSQPAGFPGQSGFLPKFVSFNRQVQ